MAARGHMTTPLKKNFQKVSLIAISVGHAMDVTMAARGRSTERVKGFRTPNFIR
jgi:hypothetical protein